MEEWGPLILNATGGLSPNPYAWTNLANVVLLESPSGVGYSYCATSSTSGCVNSDVSTARAARVAMQEFFKEFSEFADSEFYITGESYAGVYVPTLVKEILDNAPGNQHKRDGGRRPMHGQSSTKRFHGHDMVRTQERFRCRGNVRFIVEQVRRPSPSEIDDGGAVSHDHNACVEEHDDESDIERMHCCPAQVLDLNQQRHFASLAERLHQQIGIVFPFSRRFIQPAWFVELPAGNSDDA